MKILKLSNSDLPCLVDDDIWLRYCRYTWRLKKSGNASYVVCNKVINGKKETLRLHRLVMNCPPDKEVHHVNGNTRDNQRENLIIVDRLTHRIESGIKRIREPGEDG